MRFLAILAFAASLPLAAQERLSLHDAVEQALRQNKSLEASQASSNAAESRIRQARAGMLPKLDYAESLARSDNPVFVFSSLLTQHQFTQDNFSLYPLNRPGFLDNFQTSFTGEQVLFDAGRTRNAVRSAELLHTMTGEDDRQTRIEITFGVVKSYLDAALNREALAAATQAVKSAEADLAQADEIRKTGMSTDADVLSIRVHLARVREQQIRREADLFVAQAALNDALGVPLDKLHELITPLSRVKLSPSRLQELESGAVANRPEQLRANYAVGVAATQADIARSSLLPKISLRGAFEVDRQQFVGRGGANWLGAVTLNWNVFNGGADKSRIEEENESLLRARAERDRTTSSIRLEVRRAWENLRAAEQQIDVAQSAVAEAEESLRIIQNRFQAGMSTVTDLLRTETAFLESRTRYLEALHDQRLAAVLLDAADGRLSVDSPAVQE